MCCKQLQKNIKKEKKTQEKMFSFLSTVQPTSVCLLIRGHIRDTFDSSALRAWLEDVIRQFPTMRIYIHSWSKKSNGLSWRFIPENTTQVTPDMILHYLGPVLRPYIQRIWIEDDAYCPLIGCQQGNIGQSRAPLLGWKRYIWGQYHALQLIQQLEAPNTTVISTRFDVLQNSNSLSPLKAKEFVHRIVYPTTVLPLEFWSGPLPSTGCDNLFAGSLSNMLLLFHSLHNDLDTWLAEHPQLQNQEFLVLFVAMSLLKQTPPGMPGSSRVFHRRR